MNNTELINAIKSNLDHSKMISFLNKDYPVFGTYVITGLTGIGCQIIGYVCQIRKKWGAFGSDIFILREMDGTLRRHENQCFWVLNEGQIELVKPQFKDIPGEEIKDNPDLSYTFNDGEYKESGFIISEDKSPERVDSCIITTTISKKVAPHE